MIKHSIIGIHKRKIGYLTAVEKDDELAFGSVDMNFWQGMTGWERGLGTKQ